MTVDEREEITRFGSMECLDAGIVTVKGGVGDSSMLVGDKLLGH